MSDQTDAVVDRYGRFARDEAPGRSALYEEWARGIAEDRRVAALIARIRDTRRQPPLVFAVSRLLGAPESGFASWAEWVRAHIEDLVVGCESRSIQTNEPLRCAALLPALSAVDGPIALLEVGASAGLCLYPDRYSYRYETPDGVVAVDPAGGESPVLLHASWRGNMPRLRLPEVVWRAGIDLNPLDPRDAATRRWLTALVWPGESGRAERIERSLDIAAADPPLLRAGDAADGAIGELAALAPTGATLVVTTPGVLAHVPRARRGLVIDAARAAGTWITLDDPGLHDGWNAPIDPATWPAGRFALSRDGEVLAAVDPLGGFVEWRADAAASAS